MTKKLSSAGNPSDRRSATSGTYVTRDKSGGIVKVKIIDPAVKPTKTTVGAIRRAVQSAAARKDTARS